MNTETLPKTWAINVRDYRHDNTLLINFKEWYCKKANESFRFTSNYYGMSGDGEFSNYDVYNKRFTIITLEQWDAAVNKKEQSFPVQDVISDVVNKALDFSEPIKQPKLKVGDKIPEYLDGKLKFRNHQTKERWIDKFVTNEQKVNYNMLALVLNLHPSQ